MQRQIEALGQRLRGARMRRSMTQHVIAERVGVSVPTMAKLENGDPSNSLATMLRALAVLGLGGSAMVGRLTKTASRTGDTISFEYDAGWLAGASPVAAFPLDHALHLGAGPHYAKAGASALSGIFQDGAPKRDHR